AEFSEMRGVGDRNVAAAAGDALGRQLREGAREAFGRHAKAAGEQAPLLGQLDAAAVSAREIEEVGREALRRGAQLQILDLADEKAPVSRELHDQRRVEGGVARQHLAKMLSR